MVLQPNQTIVATQGTDIGCQITIRPFRSAHGVKIVASVLQVLFVVPKEFGKEPRNGFSKEGDSVDGQGRINGRVVVTRIQSLPIVLKGFIDLFRQGLGTFGKYVGFHFHIALGSRLSISWTPIGVERH
jgi:hypothetical protein